VGRTSCAWPAGAMDDAAPLGLFFSSKISIANGQTRGPVPFYSWSAIDEGAEGSGERTATVAPLLSLLASVELIAKGARTSEFHSLGYEGHEMQSKYGVRLKATNEVVGDCRDVP
jgi:hypothetical protein